MATLEACLKYFGSKDIYEIFGLPKNTNNEKESKYMEKCSFQSNIIFVYSKESLLQESITSSSR